MSYTGSGVGLRGLGGTGHASVLHVAAVGFAPARKFTLVDGVLGPYAGNVIHPDQTRACRGDHTLQNAGRRWDVVTENGGFEVYMKSSLVIIT